MDELRFDGRSVIVTGSGRGFGRAHAHLLASRGARVVVADYGVEMNGSGSSPEPARQVAEEITAAGGEAVACFANVADEAGAATIVQTVLDTFGGLDVLVNNAGIYAGEWFEDVDMAQFRRMVDFHYFGTVNMCKAALPHLKAARNGCIVNTTSEAVLGHIPKSSDYAGAKGAVLAFTKALALNLSRDGLRVNAVSNRGTTRMSTPEVLAYCYDAPIENFQGEFFDVMKTEYAAPAVAFLAHESCPLNGEVIVSGALMARRMCMMETKGLTFSGGVTPEDYAANLDALMDTTDGRVVTPDMWDSMD